MAYRNKYDKDGASFNLGANAESSFVSAAKKAGLAIRKSEAKDEFRHIDFHINLSTSKELEMSVEVKSRKKVKRSDSSVNDDLVWIEFKNVQGKRGWLYGAADLLAFERENDFLLVERKLLARLCERLCDLTKMNVDVKMPLYTGYQRRNREDVLSLIKMSDIISNVKYSLLSK
jgi:hypothetical protein